MAGYGRTVFRPVFEEAFREGRRAIVLVNWYAGNGAISPLNAAPEDGET